MSYIGNQPSGQGQAERFIFTAISTSATVTHDDAGLPISYSANHVSVFKNGVKQVIPTQVAASNGSTIVFASNLSVDDVVEVIALSTFDAATTEGTSIQSTGETGNVKFLGEDGDNSSSWKQIDSGSIATGAIDEAHIANDAVNFATHLKAGTDGELITWNASGDPAAVAVGASGHVLTSGGTGVAPTFQEGSSSVKFTKRTQHASQTFGADVAFDFQTPNPADTSILTYSSGVFTVVEAGIYLAICDFSSSDVSTSSYVYFKKNSTVVGAGTHLRSTGNDYEPHVLARVESFAVDETMHFYSDTTMTLYNLSGTIQIIRLGGA